MGLPKTAQKILSLEGISYLQKEVDQWVCYAKPGYWFPDMECETCIESNLRDLWDIVRAVKRAPESYLVHVYGHYEGARLGAHNLT
jgi:hypothetical protein